MNTADTLMNHRSEENPPDSPSSPVRLIRTRFCRDLLDSFQSSGDKSILPCHIGRPRRRNYSMPFHKARMNEAASFRYHRCYWRCRNRSAQGTFERNSTITRAFRVAFHTFVELLRLSLSTHRALRSIRGRAISPDFV